MMGESFRSIAECADFQTSTTLSGVCTGEPRSWSDATLRAVLRSKGKLDPTGLHSTPLMVSGFGFSAYRHLLAETHMVLTVLHPRAPIS